MDLQDVKALAINRMAEHGLTDWTFKFDNSKLRFGQCNMDRKMIKVSRHLAKLNGEEKVLDTILHEIAHALEWVRYGTSGHGRRWKLICMEIGARPERCYNIDETNLPESPYALSCQNTSCSNTSPRYRKTKTRYLCGRCRSKMVLVDCKTKTPVYTIKLRCN